MFLRGSWYVFGWSDEVAEVEVPVGRVMLGEPVLVWRTPEGDLVAMQNRCPHRHAPLAMGRVEGGVLQCMYHGMRFDPAGRCVAVPGMDSPPDAGVRTFPVAEKDDWIWVWMGAAEAADAGLIPDAYGLRDPMRPMRHGRIDYDAHYQLVHDNLCDLSHLDFVHETTLRPATGAFWSQSAPRVTTHERGIRIQRWFEGAELPARPGQRTDTWSDYRFVVPGVFIMRSMRFPPGTAAACGHGDPAGRTPLSENIEQQAVTPISATRTSYFFATGLVNRPGTHALDIDSRMDVVRAAFEEDRRIIEAQQRIRDLTPDDEKMVFLPQDKGPFLMRQLMARLIKAEQQAALALSSSAAPAAAP